MYTMEAIILGTGNAQATKIYNTCLIIENRGERLLVDGGGGNGILKILEEKEIPLSSINSLFITHAHIDHLLGAVWIIRRISEEINKGKYNSVFRVFAHAELIDLLVPFLKATLTKKIVSLFGEKVVFVPVRDRESFPLLGGTLTPFDIKSTKLKQFGFVLDAEGMRIVDAGDEPLDSSNFDLAKGADWLTHEAFCLYEERDIFHPYEKNHSTVKDAAMLSENLGVKNLILYHTEDRSGTETRKERYTKEAEEYYSGSIFVPDDREEIILS